MCILGQKTFFSRRLLPFRGSQAFPPLFALLSVLDIRHYHLRFLSLLCIYSIFHNIHIPTNLGASSPKDESRFRAKLTSKYLLDRAKTPSLRFFPITMGLIELATRNRRQKAEAKRQKAEAEAIEAKRRGLYSNTSSRNPYAQGNFGPYGEAKKSLVGREDVIAQSAGSKPPGLKDSGISGADAMYSASRYPRPPGADPDDDASPSASPRTDGDIKAHGLLQTDPNEPPGNEQEAQVAWQEQEQEQQQPDYGSEALPSYDDVGPPEFQTEEEQEEDEVDSTKEEIRYAKQDTVASSRKAIQAAERAERIGQDTLTRIGIQGERIHNSEMNLDITEAQNKVGRDRTMELERQNRSMFALLAPNTKRSRAKQEMRILDRHQEEREQRQKTRGAAYQTSQRMDKHFKELGKSQSAPDAHNNSVQRSKYQFEADSEDEGMEEEIDKNLDSLGTATGKLHKLALATGIEVEMQNEHLTRIMEKVKSCHTSLAEAHIMMITSNGSPFVCCRAIKSMTDFGLTDTDSIAFADAFPSDQSRAFPLCTFTTRLPARNLLMDSILVGVKGFLLAQ